MIDDGSPIYRVASRRTVVSAPGGPPALLELDAMVRLISGQACLRQLTRTEIHRLLNEGLINPTDDGTLCRDV